MSKLEEAIKAQLINNVELDDIMAEFDVSRSKVISVRRNLESSMAKGELIDQIMEDSTVQNTLMLLNTRSQQAALAVIEKAKIMASTSETAGELETLANTVTKVYTAFFVSSAPQVNIQNNLNGGASNGSSKYGFLGDKPGSSN